MNRHLCIFTPVKGLTDKQKINLGLCKQGYYEYEWFLFADKQIHLSTSGGGGGEGRKPKAPSSTYTRRPTNESVFLGGGGGEGRKPKAPTSTSTYARSPTNKTVS